MLTLDDFAPAVGDAFTLTADGAGGLPDLELVEARPVGDQPYRDRVPFALLFRGPAEPVLAQATYVFAHPRVGEHPIFVVPVASSEAGTDYEAVFV